MGIQCRVSIFTGWNIHGITPGAASAREWLAQAAARASIRMMRRDAVARPVRAKIIYIKRCRRREYLIGRYRCARAHVINYSVAVLFRRRRRDNACSRRDRCPLLTRVRRFRTMIIEPRTSQWRIVFFRPVRTAGIINAPVVVFPRTDTFSSAWRQNTPVRRWIQRNNRDH